MMRGRVGATMGEGGMMAWWWRKEIVMGGRAENEKDLQGRSLRHELKDKKSKTLGAKHMRSISIVDDDLIAMGTASSL
jgi:hypothetical protein